MSRMTRSAYGLTLDRARNAAHVDAERESAVRRFVCPICAAEPRQPCTGDARMAYSHTGRYRMAADAGAVSPLGAS